MIFLGDSEIRKAVSHAEIMAAVEQAFALHEKGAYDMPPRMHVHHGDNTLLYMPCFTEYIFGTKLLTLFPGNAEKNKPVIEGLMLLNDAETGLPLALLNGATLTALRTGGVGGVALRHTTPPTATSAGLIGAGRQGFEQLVFASKVRQLDKITVYDTCAERLPTFVDRLRAAIPNTPITIAASSEQLLNEAQIVITATNATEPVIPDCAALVRGKHFIGIGSYKPNMREFPEAVFRQLDRLFIDTEHGLHESGDLITPLEQGWIAPSQVETFGHLISTQQKSANPLGETTLFKSAGMALFDLVVAELIYRRAVEQGIGQEIVY